MQRYGKGIGEQNERVLFSIRQPIFLIFPHRMAEKKNNTFDGIMADLKKGQYAPVYILMGEEPYYIDKLCNYIEEHVLPPEERDFD